MSLALRTLSLVLATTTLAGCLGLAPGVKLPPGGRETVRAFLIGEQPEAKGYGLYSYFLFGAPPTEATRERYLNLITAYLESIPPVGSFKGSLERWELNIAYLPLKDSLPLEFSKGCSQLPCGTGNVAFAQWVLDHYNYARARVLLRAVPTGGTHRNGPYIVSSLKPLSMTPTLSPPYLYQDLSSVPPRVVLLWVKEFLDQTAQQSFEDSRKVQQVALKLRQSIAVAAKGLPEVLEALDRWIAWVH
jgi:hypothetical protein